MGCHTWFSVPVITDKKEIIKTAQEYLATCKYMDDSEKEMYQYAIDKELVRPVCDLASAINGYHRSDGWILYDDIVEYSFKKYCIDNNIDPKTKSKYDKDIRYNLESYSDEPRIGGYPNTIIRSYDEMITAMETGLPDEDGKIHQFYYEEDRKEKFMEGIKTFFTLHPQGIITFG